MVGDFLVLVLDDLSRVFVLDDLSRVFVLLQLVLVAAQGADLPYAFGLSRNSGNRRGRLDCAQLLGIRCSRICCCHSDSRSRNRRRTPYVGSLRLSRTSDRTGGNVAICSG